MENDITIYDDLAQGSLEWLSARCGLITASTVKLIMTPTGKPARNDATRTHLYELLAQRVTGYVEPTYVSDDMLRGQQDEVTARWMYDKTVAPVTEVGFITRQFDGFKLGYSPDGLVGDFGLIEIKSRRQKHQARTIIECAAAGTVPAEYALQCQTGLLVTGRQWLDYISYCGGMPMAMVRVYPDDAVHAAILEAAAEFESQLQERLETYHATVKAQAMPMTERVEYGEIVYD